MGSGSNLGDNPTNPVVPDLNDVAEMERERVELPKQLEDRCIWLEEKFKEMENVDYRCGIDAKDLSLVLDLVLPPKFKTPQFEKYNGTSCPEAHITMFCRRMTGHVNNDQLLIHCFQDSLIESAAKCFSVIAMPGEMIENTIRKLYQNLFDAHVVSPFYLKPMQPPFLKWYDANAQYEYHAGITGYSIENCTAFKNLIQKFIKMGIVKFDDPSGPNVVGNSLPSHSDKGGGLITQDLGERPGEVRDYCEFHDEEGHEIQECIEFKALIQGLMDNKELEFFEYTKIPEGKDMCALEEGSTRKNYDRNVTIPREENPVSTLEKGQDVCFYTRSGRRYDSSNTKAELVKGKSLVVEQKKEKPTKLESLINEPITEKEAKEFLKFLKHSDALMKVLNETYVADDISVNKLDRLVNNINADNFIFFNDDEILPGGMGSIKALHITTRYKGYTLPGVLIDNGSALNVLPLSILNRLPVDSSHMKTCQNIMRAFDGTERKVMGKDTIASVTSDAPYIGADDEAIECSFRSLEFVNATFIIERNKIPMPKISKTTRMGLQLMVRKGALPGRGLGRYLQGRVNPPMLKDKRDCFGLGYKPDARQKRRELEKKQEKRRAQLNGGETFHHPYNRSLDINDMGDAAADLESHFEQDMCIEDSQDFKDDRDCNLSPDLLRMVEQDEKQILPYKESGKIRSVSQFSRSLKDEVDVLLKIKEEVKKQFDTSFLQVVKYSKWVANTVFIPKKDGKVRMCVDYKDLNKASPKDNFPLPHIDTLVDNTAGYSLFSFMDGFFRYNQLKLNPAKYTLRARSRKLQGFVVSEKGIKIDLDKVKSIQELPQPRTQKEVRGLLGRLNYIAHFISQLTEKCDLIFRLLKKHNPGVWDEECLKNFDKYLKIPWDAYWANMMSLEEKKERCTISKAVKGSAIADFLACRALEDYEHLNFDLLNENMIYVATTEEKYEACIMGIYVTIERKIKVLEVYGDFALVIYQLKDGWETRDPKLISYRKLVLELIEEFDDITFYYLPRDKNQMGDALATLASMIRVNKQEDYPNQATENDKRTLRIPASDYVVDREILYKRRKDQILLRCVDTVESKKILEEAHEGICGTHTHGFTMARQIMRFGLAQEVTVCPLCLSNVYQDLHRATPFSLVYRIEVILPIEVFFGGALILTKMDGKNLPNPIIQIQLRGSLPKIVAEQEGKGNTSVKEPCKPYLPRVAVEQVKNSKSYLPEVAVEQIEAINLISLKLQRSSGAVAAEQIEATSLIFLKLQWSESKQQFLYP
ncbi:hypothetical protein EPI10_020835 [Gossypium australe]|uniref:G-patch domain-containing protein n=1 Tax=Gossypium australe TaxID=47621 RepID=A0A5B6WGD1_9ROSI|nr:hypothetical protein EPI10_020835 [Gossypium australe]